MGEQILVVEAVAVVRHTVARILAREGFQVHAASDAAEARVLCDSVEGLSVVVAGGYGPDGAEAIRHARLAHPGVRSIIIGLDSEPATGRMAHDLGVDHVRPAPVDMDDLLVTIRGLTLALRKERERNALLERLRKNVVTMVDSLAQALEARDPYTAGHSARVADYSLMIGEDLGLSDLELEVLRHGSVLHDIGKIAVREEVLNKPGRLTAEEYEHIKIHPTVGYNILKQIGDLEPLLPIV
ncbi:MAG: HD domain-containing protein, partial [Candidatus Sericytochromatia bacterium]